LNNWWDEATRANFDARAQCLIDQYTGYVEPQTGLNLSGINTQGENIADNGGIKESYRAYEKLVASSGEEKLLPGIKLNQRQLFWVSAAQVWCNVQRDEAMRNRVLTGVHSPGQFRVIGPLRNRPEFAKDFNCQAQTLMNPADADRCSVW
jgi:membrane metallo-endopeptidase-like protein 1